MWMRNLGPKRKSDDFDVNSLYHENKILKTNDFIALKNALFVKDSLQGNTPASNKPWYQKCKK